VASRPSRFDPAALGRRPASRFFVALTRSVPGLACAWWLLLVVRSLVPAGLAITTGLLVGRVESGGDLTLPLAGFALAFVLSQVGPPVHQVVGSQLHDVLILGRLTEGQQHGAPRRQLGGHGLDGRPGGSDRRPDRVVAQEVPLEAVADLLDARAPHERDRPDVLVGHVVHQVTHGPGRARCRLVPLVGLDGLDTFGEEADGLLVQRVDIHLSVPLR